MEAPNHPKAEPACWSAADTAAAVDQQAKKPRRCRTLTNSPACQVPGCAVDLAAEPKAYCLRKRICTLHMTAEALSCGGELWRFCFQCGKMQHLTEFDGAKRSCRARLLKRRTPLGRALAEAEAEAEATTATAADGCGSSNARPPASVTFESCVAAGAGAAVVALPATHCDAPVDEQPHTEASPAAPPAVAAGAHTMDDLWSRLEATRACSAGEPRAQQQQPRRLLAHQSSLVSCATASAALALAVERPLALAPPPRPLASYASAPAAAAWAAVTTAVAMTPEHPPRAPLANAAPAAAPLATAPSGNSSSEVSGASAASPAAVGGGAAGWQAMLAPAAVARPAIQPQQQQPQQQQRNAAGGANNAALNDAGAFMELLEELLHETVSEEAAAATAAAAPAPAPPTASASSRGEPAPGGGSAAQQQWHEQAARLQQLQGQFAELQAMVASIKATIVVGGAPGAAAAATSAAPSRCC